MATHSRKFLPCRSQYTASSKSRAVSPSIVTNRELAQVLATLEILRFDGLGQPLGRGRRPASRTRAAGRACAARSRSPCPGRRSCRASRSRARWARRAWSGYSMISATTTCPGFAAPRLLGPDEDVLVDALVLGDHEGLRHARRRAGPRPCSLARSSTSTMEPSRRPRRSTPRHAGEHRIAVQHLVHLLRARGIGRRCRRRA